MGKYLGFGHLLAALNLYGITLQLSHLD